jgi:hypothetical protein
MSSKYDIAWRKIFADVGGFESILRRVRAGEVVLLPAEELKKFGERSNWLGNVLLTREGVVGDPGGVAAHVRALKNILPEHIFRDEQIKCVMSRRGGQLTLTLRLLGADAAPVRKVILVKPEGPAIEPSLSPEDLGEFYILISSFERELRNFLKKKIGKGWVKRLRHDLKSVVERWEERKAIDSKWGIEPERELINYADLTDYIQIVAKYRRIFSESEEDLRRVRIFFELLANYGRNPLMHCRTLDQKKYSTTQSAVDFLREWIRRRTDNKQ